MSNVYVLDACALIATARNEDGTAIVADAYDKASKNEAVIIINRVNLLEVFYEFYRYKGKEYADNFVNEVKKSDVQIYEFDESLFEEAGRLKATYRISLADSIALAQAIKSGGELLTSDHHEFDPLDGVEPITFHWIR